MKQRHYLPAADILRVLCIGLIAWYHFWQLSWLNPGFHIGSVHINLQQMIRNGYMLVDMLLLLSGFLLALPYARVYFGREAMPKAADFYKKRLIRIVPSYLFAIAAAMFLWAIPTGQYGSLWEGLRDVLTHLSFTHNLFRATLYDSKLPGVLWTLAVEVQFYLLFPLIGRFYAKKPALVSLLLIAAGQLFKLWAVGFGDIYYWVNQLPLLLDVYGVGMLGAWMLARLETAELPHRRFFPWLAILCLVCIFQMMYLQVISDGWQIKLMQLIWRLPMAIMGGGFLLFASLSPQKLLNAAGNPVTRFLSGISYNFYIWHQFLARRMVDWNFPRHIAELPNQCYEQPWQSRYSLLVWLAALAAAVLCTYLIEKPAAKLLRKKLL